jgi:hypothetical protein
MKSAMGKAMTLLALAGTMVLWAGVGPAWAADYVVDGAAPGAADTNPGTEERPWKTVQHAADVVRPGDTVNVMAGRYDGRVVVMKGEDIAVVNTLNESKQP